MEKDPTLKQILLATLNVSEGWVSKGTLGLVAEQNGYLPESVGRHLRKMAELNEIQVSYYKGKRNQKLSRYAKLNTPTPQKPKYEQICIDGQWVARLLT